ncbi:hypothetical protein [Lysobacter gummosus]|uniref:hypothetical protein n=1 Tax=Lysobacter gummosus TaxID=262324 RepID=UPI00363922DC
MTCRCARALPNPQSRIPNPGPDGHRPRANHRHEARSRAGGVHDGDVPVRAHPRRRRRPGGAGAAGPVGPGRTRRTVQRLLR